MMLYVFIDAPRPPPHPLACWRCESMVLPRSGESVLSRVGEVGYKDTKNFDAINEKTELFLREGEKGGEDPPPCPSLEGGEYIDLQADDAARHLRRFPTEVSP